MSSPELLDPTILREYDIRGIVDENLTARDAFNIGRAFGSQLIENGGSTAAVGYDGRISSPKIEIAVVDGLVSCGIEVIRIGMGPTPMLNFGVHHLKTDAGIMITGSHNPPQYNGVKMSMLGQAFFGRDIKALGVRCKSQNFVKGKGKVLRKAISENYVARLFSDFEGYRDLRVGWDPGNGASGEIVAKLIKKLPGTHFIINSKVDGNFPAHHPDPTVEENLTQLKSLVSTNSCEIGIAFDGDGDRIGVIDNNGRVLWGDQLLVILAREVLLELPGATILADVKASQIFLDEIKRLGGHPVLWKSGHSNIKTKMVELSSPIAGEMSAHIFFKHRYYGYDDGIYAAVRLLSILASSTKTLAQIYDELPKMFNTPEIRIDCLEEEKFLIIDRVKEKLKGISGIQINEIDGVRVTSKDGWWLLRASNTQPALVARCEASTENGLHKLKKKLVKVLKHAGVSIELDKVSV